LPRNQCKQFARYARRTSLAAGRCCRRSKALARYGDLTL